MSGSSAPASDRDVWTLRLLGGWNLERGGVPVFLHRRERRVLALLALREPLRRESLAAELWPDSAVTHAHLSLRTALHQLRRSAPGLVQATAEQLRFSPGMYTDVGLLCRCAQRTSQDAGSVAPIAVLTSGPLLPGWDEEWLDAPRAHLERHRLAALEQEASARLDVGDAVAAADLAEEAVAVDPLRETSHYLLVRAYLAAGNRARAILAYRRLAGTLEEELGVPPSMPLQAVLGSAGGRTEVVDMARARRVS